MSELLENDKAERGLVSCVLQGADIPEIGPDWFTDSALWELLEASRISGRTNPAELAAWLKGQGKLDRVPPAFMVEVYRFAPSAASSGYYLEECRKARLKRRLQAFASSILAKVATTDPDELNVLIEKDVMGISDDLGDSNGVPSMNEAAHAVLAELETRVQAKSSGVYPGIPSGIKDLDDATNGFQPGRVYVFGARPGMGKTSLVRQIMLKAASHGFGSYFLNLEMSAAQTFEALISTQQQVDFGAMQSGALTDWHFNKIQRGMKELVSLPIHCDDRFLKVPQIERMVRKMVRQKKIKLFCLDYIQLVPASSSEEERNPQLRIGNASNMLVRIAKENNIPVIALAQLNREAESEPAGSLSRKHLRDCGQIEQDAWFIGLLGDHGNPKADQDDDTFAVQSRDEKCRDIGLVIDKNRSGRPNGYIKLRFQGQFLRFLPATYE